MYVLALVTQKGGSGKSTLAVGLAVAAMENGERVAFVEADPQGTISKWKERRGNAYPSVVRVADPAELEGALFRLQAQGIWPKTTTIPRLMLMVTSRREWNRAEWERREATRPADGRIIIVALRRREDAARYQYR